ncbi:DUF4209 domain-containing protein [Pseudomonas viridiflava]|uniref:DUF4209 domain-containing protein n=1 Tax=Pseudomonas viridiflava TaxID=33069 RepID=UPI000F06598B|nr:DUF4209 domain-containing protein [Pseudomonas viridiflava]
MPEQYYRYPHATPLTIEAFRSLELSALLRDSRPNYHDISRVLADGARLQMQASDHEKARVLWLLSDLCSMMLNPSNHQEPLRPFAVFPDRRSFDISDLTADEYEFSKLLVDDLETGLIKARLAEILWLNPDRNRVNYALSAIEGYQTASLTDDLWCSGGQECWERALMLAKSLGKGGRAAVEQLTDVLFNALEHEFQTPSSLLAHLAETVLEHRLAHALAADLPEKLERAGQAFERNGELFRARHCFELASDAYRLAKNQIMAARMVIAVAQTWKNEAQVRNDGSNAQPLIAMNHLAKALQIYRQVPQKFRDELGIAGVYEHLRNQIAEAGSLTVEKMVMVSSPTVDITKMVNMALEQISGKDGIDALRTFTTLHPFASPTEARKGAKQTLGAGFLRALHCLTHVDSTGRVIAKAPGMSMNAVATASDEERIWAEMVKGHECTRDLTVHGLILPGLRLLQREHGFKEYDLIDLAKASALVPPERAGMIGKGLYWGTVGEFGMAVHFLIPQVENIVRYHMKAAGLNTSNTDRNDVVNENGLSTLLDVEGVEKVFGQDVVFELKALFCSSFGPNLRNDFAHGLIDDSDFYSVSVVYAWWFTLKWVAMPYWEQLAQNEALQQSANPDADADASGEGEGEADKA